MLALRFLLCISPVLSQSYSRSDCSALESLYNATTQRSWLNESGWKSSPNCCRWYGVKCDPADFRVIALNLSSNGLFGTIPPAVQNLQRLTSLTLSHNKMSGTIPDELMRIVGEYRCENSPINYQSCDPFKDSTNKDVDCNGGACTFVGGLNQLRLDDNRLRGTIPESISRLFKTLQILDLNTNQLEGPIPKSIGALTQLVELDLYFNTLASSIPSEVGLLTNLRYLNVGFNLLNGTIPSALANLVRMEYLDLSVNRFHGSVPQQIGVLVDPPPTAACDNPGGSCFGATMRNLSLSSAGPCQPQQLVLRYLTAVKMPCNAGVRDQTYWCSNCNAPYSASAASPIGQDCYSGLPSPAATANLYTEFLAPPYAPPIGTVPTPTIGPKLRISVLTRCTYAASLYAVVPS